MIANHVRSQRLFNIYDLPKNLPRIDTALLSRISPKPLNQLIIATTLTDAIKNAQTVNILLFSSNFDIAMPVSDSAILNMKQLYYVSLPSAQFTNSYIFTNSYFYDHLYLLPELRAVDWGNQNIPLTIRRFKKLESITLTSYTTPQLQDSISKLSNLRSLNIVTLKDTTKIFQINNSICRLKNLQYLTIWGNEITKLPDSIGLLKRLKVLSIQGTRISSLPDQISLLDSLNVLDISASPRDGIFELPEDIGNLKNLRTLRLGVLIKNLPISFSTLNQLENLSLSCSGLSEFPLALTMLDSPIQFIDIDCSGLTVLPDEIGNICKSNRSGKGTIMLHRCDLITKLPAGIVNLKLKLDMSFPASHIDISALDKLTSPFYLTIFSTSSRYSNIHWRKIARSLKKKGSFLTLEMYTNGHHPLAVCRLKNLNRIIVHNEQDHFLYKHRKRKLERRFNPDQLKLIKSKSV